MAPALILPTRARNKRVRELSRAATFLPFVRISNWECSGWGYYTQGLSLLRLSYFRVQVNSRCGNESRTSFKARRTALVRWTCDAYPGFGCVDLHTGFDL